MCCVILIFKKCQSEQNENNYCKNNCIKPKGSVNNKITDVIIEVNKNEEELYPPTKGNLELIASLNLFILYLFSLVFVVVSAQVLGDV